MGPQIKRGQYVYIYYTETHAHREALIVHAVRSSRDFVAPPYPAVSSQRPRARNFSAKFSN